MRDVVARFADGSAAGQPVAVLDIEASAFPAPGSFPVEIGVSYVATGETRSWLLAPTRFWRLRGTWDIGAERVHGIRQRKLVDRGLPPERVLAELRAAVEGHTVVSENPGADAYWLRVLDHAVETAGRDLGGWGDIIIGICDRPALFPIRRADALLDELTVSGGLAGAAEIETARDEATRRLGRKPHRAGPDSRHVAEVFRVLMGADGRPSH